MSETEKAMAMFEKRNFWLKANPVCQSFHERVEKQNSEIERNNMALCALREKAEREKPCGFIHDLYIEKRWAYCPHCGRKLVP